jgi:hypothetical protein
MDGDHWVRKAKAWTVCYLVKKIWRSFNLRRVHFKIRLLVSTVVSILVYGSETSALWALADSMNKCHNGCYTTMHEWHSKLQKANREVYGNW